jgi:biopolymer transport protein ExbD
VIRITTPLRGIGNVDVAVVPMINIVFLLLLYFLVAGKLTDTAGPVIELPGGGGAAAMAPPATVLTLDAEGSIYLGAELISDEELSSYLGSLPASARLHHLQLRADSRADTAAVHRVMDACREAGIVAVEIATLDES